MQISLVVVCTLLAYQCDVLTITCDTLKAENGNKRAMVVEELTRQERGFAKYWQKQALLNASFTLKMDLKD